MHGLLLKSLFPKEPLKETEKYTLGSTFSFKVTLLKCNYTFKYWVISINFMYFLYG